jgi:hypothetical protein
MKVLHRVGRVLSRFRYPVSLPEDVSKAVGLPLSNLQSFDKMLSQLTASNVTTIRRHMPRDQVKQLFEGATRKEYFSGSALFSFWFPSGWLEFSIHFDRCDRVRRVCLLHKNLDSEVELPLAAEV